MEAALMNKKQLGQFFTTESDYILAGLQKYVRNKTVCDPFAGSCDLIKWAKRNGAKSISGFDIDKNYVDNKVVFLNDSIRTPRTYDFVLTNPPYLNVNKANATVKSVYFTDRRFEDLYQLSLESIMNSNEGIVIVPINFLSAENSAKIRKLFFSKFQIMEMNYFKEQVFPDTTYNVIAFYYKRNENSLSGKFAINTHIYPDKKNTKIELKKQYDWSIGGDTLGIIRSQENFLGVRRLLESDLEHGPVKITISHNHIKDKRDGIGVSKDFYSLLRSNILFLKAIDSGTSEGKIALEDIRNYQVAGLLSKESSRNMIHLIFKKKIPIKEQQLLMNLFNHEMNKLRENHLSLFLTNFRDNDRKRVSFDFVYKFLNYLYNNYITKSESKTTELKLFN